jgi:hypothetical protein
MQKKGIKVQLAKIDELETELKSNKSELDTVLSKYSLLLKEATSLQESYAYLSAQYSSMKNLALEIGDSNLTNRIVKSLSDSNTGYKQINDIYQKIK